MHFSGGGGPYEGRFWFCFNLGSYYSFVRGKRTPQLRFRREADLFLAVSPVCIQMSFGLEPFSTLLTGEWAFVRVLETLVHLKRVWIGASLLAHIAYVLRLVEELLMSFQLVLPIK